MADLMTDQYDYQTLSNKYGNFHHPCVKVFINGTDVLASKELMLEEISVVLSLTSASSVQMKLGNVYDVKNRSFRSGITDKFKPGTIMEVALGYDSSTVKIFKGFVYMLGVDFSNKMLLVVTAMDVRKLMMISGNRHVLHNAKNYSDVVKTIMSSYSQLCAAEIKATSDNLEVPISQTCNDYDFIMKELIKKGRCNREFLVVGDKAYFRERPKSGASMMKIEWGRELLQLQMDYSYLDMNIEVMGFHVQEQMTYVKTAVAQSEEPQKTLVSPKPVWHISDPSADNQDKVSQQAETIAKNQIEQAKAGKIMTIGIPELVPGRFLEVVKVEPMVNRKYYLSEVRHNIDSNYYVTECEIGGWI